MVVGEYGGWGARGNGSWLGVCIQERMLVCAQIYAIKWKNTNLFAVNLGSGSLPPKVRIEQCHVETNLKFIVPLELAWT